MRIADDPPPGSREVEDGSSAHVGPRLARADGPLGGRAGQGRRRRSGPSCRPRSRRSRPAARSTCPSRTARSWRSGYAPTKHTGKFTAKVDLPKITAFRLELLNDANLPAYGPGRSFKGTLRPDRVRGRGRPGRRRRRRSRRSSSRRRPPTSSSPRRRSSRTSTTRSGKKRVTGPAALRHRRQGRDRLGDRRRPGPPQRRARGRLRRREADRASRRAPS